MSLASLRLFGADAALKRALNDAYRGEFSVLVVWVLDRLTRGGADDALRLSRQFRERGCIIVSIQETWLNGNAKIQDVLGASAGGWRSRSRRAGRPGSRPTWSDARPRASRLAYRAVRDVLGWESSTEGMTADVRPLASH